MKTKKFLSLACLLLLTLSAAHAADKPEDEDLPVGGPTDQVGEDLPPPSAGRPEEPSGNETVPESKMPQKGTADEFYMPGSASDVSLPVMGTSGPTLMSGSNGEEVFPRETNMDRPSFQIYLGAATKAYPTILVPDNVPGIGAGISIRLMNLGQTVFLHGVADISYFSVGPVGNWAGVKDRTYHVGGLIEFGLGRRFSLLGGLIRRWNYVSTDPHMGLPSDELQLFNIGEERRWHLGMGAQYDFHVIPHGSLGVRVYIEQDYGMASLIMAIEPRPKQKMSLNYKGL